MPPARSISSNFNKQQIKHDRFNGKWYAGTFLAPFRTSEKRGEKKKALNKEKQEEEKQNENRNTAVMCTDSSRNTANMLSDNETHCLMKQMACVSSLYFTSFPAKETSVDHEGFWVRLVAPGYSSCEAERKAHVGCTDGVRPFLWFIRVQNY